MTVLHQDSYTIKLPQFEGPFDLLLFFIERDELDIHDIPISKITQDFLDYIRAMEVLNIDLASEFIYVAVTLMAIKAKMLLPRQEKDAAGQEIDPRKELVQRLLEYKKYKEACADFGLLEEKRQLRMERGNVSALIHALVDEAVDASELESVTVFRLFKAFQRVMYKLETRNRRDDVHQVAEIPYTIQLEGEVLRFLVDEKKKLSFEDAFGDCRDRVHGIVRFLALLEMLNQMEVTLVPGMEVNEFWLYPYQEPVIPEELRAEPKAETLE